MSEAKPIAPSAEYQLGREIAELVSSRTGLFPDAITQVVASSERIVVTYGTRVGPDQITARVLTLDARTGLVSSDTPESLQRGMRVVVTGRLKTRQYETREGEKRTSVEIDVEEVGPSLKNATAKVQKATRSEGGSARAGQAPEHDPWSSPAAQDAVKTANDPWGNDASGAPF